MNEGFLKLLEIWHIIMWGGTFIFLALGLAMFIFHWIKQANIKDYKKKYDYVSRHEVKRLSRGVAYIAIGFGCYVNTTYVDTVVLSPIWFFVRLFIAICFATLIFYVSYLMFKYSYPSKLTRKLKKLRYKPRRSPDGNVMKLLSEEEEDVHLESGMQAEENVFSVDYDVWVDERTGHVQIEKYPGHLQALECNSCGFQTMKVKREEIITNPTKDSTGMLTKHYECAYCGAKRKKNFRIAKLSESDDTYQLPEHLKFKEDRKVDLIKIEIFTSEGKTKSYEFQNLRQVKQFVSELEDENLIEQEEDY